MTADWIFTTAPGTGEVIETTETLPASAINASSLSTIAVVRTSGTVLTLFNGASSAAPQYIRFNPKSRVFTATVTLTLSAGTGSGKVTVYGRLKNDGSVEIAVEDTSGNTFTGTPVIYTLPGAGVARFGSAIIPLWTWTITAGAWAVGGGVQLQTNQDCWLDMLEIANTTGGAVTVTATDGQSTALNCLDAASIGANTTSQIVFPGGRFFDGGLQLTAGAANSIDCHWRFKRLRQSAISGRA